MSAFSIHVGNHFSNPGIADTVRFLARALKDCGHDVQINLGIDPSRINLVMEHFVDQPSIDRILNGHLAGARYILIGTELLADGTFNSQLNTTDGHYDNTGYWQKRFDAFMLLTPLADAVWVLAESMVAQYRAVLPGLTVQFLPHGFVHGFAFFEHSVEEKKDIDFYFSGTMTNHRKRILQALSLHHRVCFDHQHTGDYMRFEHLSRSKVCLSLRLSGGNVNPSVSRMHFHLQHRSYLLHERYENRCILDPYVLHVPNDDFIEWAGAALELPDRRGAAEGIHAKFRNEMPMSRLLPPILDASLSTSRSMRPMHISVPAQMTFEMPTEVTPGMTPEVPIAAPSERPAEMAV